MKLKRVLSMALCVLMLLSLLPVGALAAEDHCEHHPAGHACGANCDYICETCVAEIQAMVKALPEMTAITEANKSDVAAALTAIQQRYVLISDAAREKIDFTKFSDAAFVMDVPENFFGFCLTKRYEAGSGPEAAFAFLDGDGEPVKLVSADGVELSETEPLAAGGSGYYYLPAGTYRVEEYVDGQWELSLSVNGAPVNEIGGTAGSAYRIMAVNVFYRTFTVDQVEYRINDDDVTVTVHGMSEESDTLNVPVTVEHEGVTYPVSGIDEYFLYVNDIRTIHYAGTKEQWDENIGASVTAETLEVQEIRFHEHSFGSSETCLCGETAVASITLADGTTTYYAALNDAIDVVTTPSSNYLYTDCTVTLLKDSTEAVSNFLGERVKCTLDLGGHTLTDTGSTGIGIHTNATVTVKNGTVDAKNSGGIVANTGAKVTLQGVTMPTVEPLPGAVIAMDGDCSLTSHARMNGGELVLTGAPSVTGFYADGAQFIFKAGFVTVNCDLGDTVYKVRGSGTAQAVYPLVFAQPGENITLKRQSFTPAETGYFVGYAADGKLALYEGECGHSETNADGRCDVCDAAFVAKLSTTAGESYYADMTSAVSAWAENSLVSGEKTLTLLQSGAWKNLYSSLALPNAVRILELNGFELTVGTHAVQPQGTQLIIRDSSSAGSGVLKAYFDDAAASSLTLESGQLKSDSYAAIFNEEGSSVTVTGGSIAASAYDYAVKAPLVTVSGTAAIEGPVYYGEGTVLAFSGYTGEGLDVLFVSDYAGGTDITLPENYGFHDSTNVQLTGTIAAGTTARVQLIHEHVWNYSAEGAVITAVCSGSVGICPVEGRTATVTLAASDANPTYNGAGYPCSAVHSVPGLFNVSDGDIVYSTEGNTVPVNAGSYTASLSCGGATATLSYEIKPATTGLWSISPIADQTYTGSAITPAVEVSGGSEGTDYTVTYENNVNAGTARVIVTGKGNYSGSIESSFVIKPAAIQITATLAKDSYAYTGSPIEPEITVKTSFGGTEVNLARDMDYKLSGESKTEAGSVVTVKVEAIAGGNFVFEPVTLQYRIVQAEPACQLPGGFTATYGQHLFMLSLPEAENGSWSWRVPTASVGAAGDQTHSAVFTPTDTANYKAVYVDVTVKVNPAVLTVTGVNIANKVYDGSDQMAVSSLAISGRVGSDDVTVAGLSTLKGTAPSANVGAYTEVTLPVLSLSGAAAGNYTLTQPGKIGASYAIGPKTVMPTVEVAAGSYVYNGKAHTPVVTLKDGSAVIPASEYTVRYDCNINAGTGRAYISDNAGGNYTVAQAEGTFTIQKAVITITADNKTATVGQTAPTPTYSTAGVVSGETFRVLPIVAYVSKPDMSKAGTAVIRAGGAVAPSDNYSIQYVDGTLTVKAASGTGGGTGGYGGNVAVTVDMSDVKLESKTYDGKPLSYSGKASARYYYGDFTYTWYTANGYRLSEAPTDAGDYVLRATVSRSGYSGYASKKVSILKAQLIITADDLKAEVGDELPELSYSVKGLAAGEKLKTEPKLSFETEPDMGKAGKTPILVSGAAVPDSKNYETAIKYIEGTLTVDDAEAETEEVSGDTEPATEPEALLKLEVSVGEENKALDKKLGSKESAYYNLALQRSEDGGQSWNASTEQLPEGGVKVSLPLPEGSDENCSFRVIHDGGEYPVTVTKHEDGKYYLDFTAAKLGTVAVGWTAPGREGGFPWWILLAALGLTGAAGGGYAFWRKRKKNRE